MQQPFSGLWNENLIGHSIFESLFASASLASLRVGTQLEKHHFAIYISRNELQHALLGSPTSALIVLLAFNYVLECGGQKFKHRVLMIRIFSEKPALMCHSCLYWSACIQRLELGDQPRAKCNNLFSGLWKENLRTQHFRKSVCLGIAGIPSRGNPGPA